MASFWKGFVGCFCKIDDQVSNFRILKLGQTEKPQSPINYAHVSLIFLKQKIHLFGDAWYARHFPFAPFSSNRPQHFLNGDRHTMANRKCSITCNIALHQVIVSSHCWLNRINKVGAYHPCLRHVLSEPLQQRIVLVDVWQGRSRLGGIINVEQ